MESFAIPHAAWLLLTAAFSALCVTMDGRSPVSHIRLRVGLVALLVFNETTWTIYRTFALGIPFVENLPLHLCDIAVFVLLAALVTRNERLAEWSYFAGVSGALLAICMPAVSETGAIRTVAELRYFTTHIAIVGGGLYVTFGRGFIPDTRSALRALLAVHAYALLITPLNLALGANYFFTLAAPPELSWVAAQPHAVFLAGVSAVFAVTFLLMSVPSIILRRPART